MVLLVNTPGVLVLFGLLSLATSSAWAQGGTAMKFSFVGRASELTMSTPTSGAVGGAVLDEPMGAELSLAAPKGFGTMHRLQSRGSMPNNGLPMEFAEARPLALDFIERNGDVRAIRQMQPTKLKTISRTKAIIIAAVAVTVAIIVFYTIVLKSLGCLICTR